MPAEIDGHRPLLVETSDVLLPGGQVRPQGKTETRKRRIRYRYHKDTDNRCNHRSGKETTAAIARSTVLPTLIDSVRHESNSPKDAQRTPHPFLTILTIFICASEAIFFGG